MTPFIAVWNGENNQLACSYSVVVEGDGEVHLLQGQ